MLSSMAACTASACLSINGTWNANFGISLVPMAGCFAYRVHNMGARFAQHCKNVVLQETKCSGDLEVAYPCGQDNDGRVRKFCPECTSDICTVF